MSEAQNHCCAICRRPETQVLRKGVAILAVDHDHETGKVRKLLCRACNSGLGFFQDNPEWLREAADYLENR